jgi:hypothetical protein
LRERLSAKAKKVKNKDKKAGKIEVRCREASASLHDNWDSFERRGT